jgi:hypothetical protein
MSLFAFVLFTLFFYVWGFSMLPGRREWWHYLIALPLGLLLWWLNTVVLPWLMKWFAALTIGVVSTIWFIDKGHFLWLSLAGLAMLGVGAFCRDEGEEDSSLAWAASAVEAKVMGWLMIGGGLLLWLIHALT